MTGFGFYAGVFYPINSPLLELPDDSHDRSEYGSCFAVVGNDDYSYGLFYTTSILLADSYLKA